MKSNLQHKILLALSKSKKDKGFTLIELLVVIIIIGVLSAVALPNLLGQVGRARETEARNGMGAVNRAQQANHFEKQEFAHDVDVEDPGNPLGVLLSSDFYSFNATTGADASEDARIDTNADAGNLDSDDSNVRNYAAGIAYDAGEYGTVVCVSDDAGGTVSITNIADVNAIDCDDGSSIGG